MPRVSSDGVSISYERDRGDGPAVVLLSGLGFGRWIWRWQRDGLAGYDVIVPDTRGTGRSEAGLPLLVPRLPRRLRSRLLRSRFRYGVEGLAADLEAVLDDAGVYNAHLVGADLGGMIALQYALEYRRASSLTLIGTSHGGVDAVAIDEDVPAQLLSTTGSPRASTRERLRPVFSDRFTNRNPHLLDRIIEWQREYGAPDPALEAQLGALESFDVGDRLEEIRVPTLVIHGSDDRVIPVWNGRLLDIKLPASQYFEIEGGSHACGVEHAEQVTDRLLSFLRELEATPASV